MEYRPHAMASAWQREGHDVTLIAGSYSHLRRSNPNVTKDGEEQVIDRMSFRFIRTKAYSGNGLGRILSWAEFVGKGWLAAPAIAKELRPDVVISSSTYPMDTWFAARVARLARARLIHEIHDVWPMTPIELGGHSPGHPLMRLIAKAERDAYRNSDAIVSILPNVEPHVRALGFATPVVHVPNGIEVTDAGEPAPAELVNLIEGLHAVGTKVVGYAGGMSLSNAMDTFVAAMGRLRDQPITAVLLGDGELRADLEAQANRLGAKVRFVGSVPKNQVRDILRRMDVLYLGSKKSRLYEHGVSANKIFDYMLTGVPIVDAWATAHSPLVYSGCAIRAEAENPASIADALVEAASLPTEQVANLGRRAIQYVRQNHALDRLAADFLAALQPLAGQSDESPGPAALTNTATRNAAAQASRFSPMTVPKPNSTATT